MGRDPDMGSYPVPSPVAGEDKKYHTEALKEQGALLDNEELIRQLFARFGGIPLFRGGKPVTPPCKKDAARSPNMENAKERWEH